jgi:hypothetical protein
MRFGQRLPYFCNNMNVGAIVQWLSLLAVVPSVAVDISLGPLASRQHGVSGTVVILSEMVLEIVDFTYDGK